MERTYRVVSRDQLLAEEVGYSLPSFGQQYFWVTYNYPNNYFADTVFIDSTSSTHLSIVKTYSMNKLPNQFTGLIFDGGVLVNPPHDSNRYYFQLGDSNWAWLPAFAVTSDPRLTRRWQKMVDSLMVWKNQMSLYDFVGKAACTLPLPAMVTDTIVEHICRTVDLPKPYRPKDLIKSHEVYRIMSAYTAPALNYQKGRIRAQLAGHEITRDSLSTIRAGDTLVQYYHHFLPMVDQPLVMVVEQAYGDSLALRTVAPVFGDLFPYTTVDTWFSRFESNLEYLALRRAAI
ncbi:MAG: hypothetical protein WC808_00940 [Patescibacteria group bacterium]